MIDCIACLFPPVDVSNQLSEPLRQENLANEFITGALRCCPRTPTSAMCGAVILNSISDIRATLKQIFRSPANQTAGNS